MKTTIEDAKEKKQFKPITVKFVIENKKDAEVMYKFMRKHRCINRNTYNNLYRKIEDNNIDTDCWDKGACDTRY